MKTFPFSRLQSALLAVGSFSYLGFTPTIAYAEQENEIQRLPTITVTAEQNANHQNSVNLSGFAEQTIAKIPASINRWLSCCNGYRRYAG